MHPFGTILSSACAILLCQACSHGLPAEPETEQHVTFAISNTLQYASLADETDSAAQTVENLLFFLYGIDANERIAGPVSQHVGEDGFGRLNAALPPGEYRLTVIGYYGSPKPDFRNNTLEFEHSTVPITYLSSETYTVNSESREAEQVKLKRIVAGLQFEIMDSIPEGTHHFVIQTHGGSSRLNCLLGSASDSKGRRHQILIPKSKIGKSRVVLTSYLYLHHQEEEVDVTLTACNAENQPMYTHAYQGVRLGRNRLLHLKCRFFTPSNDVSDRSCIEEDLGYIWQ